MEEDFYVDLPSGISFGNKDIAIAIKQISDILEDSKRNDFKFLCSFRTLIKESSRGGVILSGDISSLKYTWLTNDIQLLDFLQKTFGFSQKYLESITRVICKFLCVNSQNACVPFYKFSFCDCFPISKLQELLPLSDEQIKTAFDKKYLTIKSTRQDIRDYIKSLKGKPANKVIEENSEDEEVPIDKCQQYVVFSLDDFEFIKEIVLDKKNKLNDTSAVISAMIKYFKDNNIKL